MRIIAGTYRGRVLRPPKGLPVRPTTDRTKEALFNILQHQLVWGDTDVLDLFAGTGNISLECWSRGARRVVSVDQHPRCVQAIRKALADLRIEGGKVIKRDVMQFIRRTSTPFNLVFMDPPYALPEQEEIAETLLTQGWIAPEGWLVAEHSTHRDYSHIIGHEFSRVYGSSTLSFFKAEARLDPTSTS